MKIYGDMIAATSGSTTRVVAVIDDEMAVILRKAIRDAVADVEWWWEGSDEEEFVVALEFSVDPNNKGEFFR